MQFHKVSCISCARYCECPQKTRLFVNYCGSEGKRIEQKISEAAADCRMRRGLLSYQNFLRAIPVIPALREERVSQPVEA